MITQTDMIRALRDQRDEAVEQLRQVAVASAGKPFLRLGDRIIRKRRLHLLRLLMSWDVVSTETISKLVCPDCPTERYPALVVFQLRQDLAPLGVSIGTTSGVGYSISAADRLKVLAAGQIGQMDRDPEAQNE